MTVYWDLMFIINFFVDYLIIYSTAKIGYLNTDIYRMFFASLFGGIAGIFVFEIKYSFVFLVYILLSLAINYIAFKKIDFKILITFYIVTFIYGGIGNYVNNLFGVMRVENGFLYFENNIIAVILSITICTFLVIMLLKLFKRCVIKSNLYNEIEIIYEGKNVSVTGYMDTGNLLLDPITQYPVILVDYEKVMDILPEPLKTFLNKGTDLSYSLSRKYLNRIRLIPYKNSSSENILKGFKPDKVIIKGNKDKEVKDVIIAVTYGMLSENKDFDAILNPQI